MLRNALSLAVDVMEAERGFVYLRQGHRFVSVCRAGSALKDEPSGPPPSVLARALDDGEVVFTTDAASDPRLKFEPAIAALQLRSIACVPLTVGEKIIGAIYLDSCSAPASLRNGDSSMLIAFAQQAALAIDYARMFEEEHERAGRISGLQAFQARILEAIAHGVITLSPSGAITTFNRSAEATFGLSAHEMIGRDGAALAPLVPDFPELLDTFFDSGAVQLRAEVEVRRTDGNERTLEIQLAPLHIPEGLGVAIVVTDVTKHRRLEIAHEAQVIAAARITETFSRYLAPHVVESLMTAPGPIKLGGERQLATMLFADIRGFTSLAAQLPAETVVEFLNTYFEEAVRIVFEYDGLLDKFYGDGLMAVFGPPRVRGDDAERAVAAAIRLHEAVERLAPRLSYSLKISVGLATGEVVAGNIGSTKRMDYTVIGDAVNLASGLQAAAPPGSIFCDEATIARAGTISIPLERRTARIKGRTDIVSVYAIKPPPGSIASRDLAAVAANGGAGSVARSIRNLIS